MKKVFKNQFVIKSWRTGRRLLNQENQFEYGVFTKDGTTCVKRGFYNRHDADMWLSKTVKLTNELIKAGKI